MTIQQADAIKFLELLLSECSMECEINGRDGDHKWRKCRRCLAMAQLEGHHKLARSFVEHAVTALKDAGAAALSRQIEDRKPEVSQQSAALSQPSRQLEIEQGFRNVMWLNHGHNSILYGDDGEMQCAKCGTDWRCWDYKNAPLADVVNAYNMARLKGISEAMASEPSAALVPQGWQTCATCQHFDSQGWLDGSGTCAKNVTRGSHDVHQTFGCIFHTPLSPDPPHRKYHAVTPPMMPAPYQPARDISDQVFPKSENKPDPPQEKP